MRAHITRLIATLLVFGCGIALTLLLSGCNAKQTRTVTFEAKAEATPRVVFLCGARNKDGSTCKNHVKAAGLHCHLHQDQ